MHTIHIYTHLCINYYTFELGPFFLPMQSENLLLYNCLFFARPVNLLPLLNFGALGVWFLTLPARANDPCTFPKIKKKKKKNIYIYIFK